MTDDEFLAAFEACTLPRPEWTHEAHVRMAWLYFTRLPAAAAADRIRVGIRRYNASVGSDGYHETITVAFARVIAARVRGGESFTDFRDREPDLFDRKSSALLRYYSDTLLHSPAAKLEFVEPDREPLPDYPGE